MMRLVLVILLAAACGDKKKEAPAAAPSPTPSAPVATPRPEPPITDDEQAPQTRQATAAAAGSAAAGFRPGGDVRVAITSRTAKGKSTLTDEAVAQKITSAYLANLKRCYRTVIAKDPKAQGSVTLALTVGANGKTSAATARGFPAAELDACVERQMKVWRFPAPTDGTAPSFELVVTMAPPP